MRALIDLPQDQVAALAEIGRRRRQPRAALIREAISAFVASETASPRSEARGLWGMAEDGLAYEDRVRAEW